MTADDASIVDAVQSRGEGWLPGAGPVQVEVRAVDRRTYADIHHLRLRRGEARRDVVVKAARPGPASRAGGRRPARPLLITPPEPSQRWVLERDALRMISTSSAIAADPGLHALEVLGELDGLDAVVLERVDAPTLRDVTNRALLVRGVDELALAAHRRAGRWLRAYHDLTPPTPVTPLRGTRDEVIALVHALCDHLAQRSRRSREITVVAARTERLARRWLPERLPIGLRHDDFAPRNILVRSDDVIVLDVLARWCAPIYEDLGCYVSWLRSDLLALASRGVLARPPVRQTFEAAFLRGYFGGSEVPEAAVRLHELVTALDRLCAWADDGRGDAAPLRRVRGRARRAVGAGPLWRRATAIVDELEAR